MSHPEFDPPFRTYAPLYWAKGYSVVPVEPKSKATKIKGWTGFVNGPPSPDKQREWVERFPNHGIGLLLGTEMARGERIAAIDVDQDDYVALTAAVLGSDVRKRGQKGETFFIRYQGDRFPFKELKDADERHAVDCESACNFDSLSG